MAYCSISEVDDILAKALTSGTNPQTQTRRNLLLIGNVRDKTSVPDDIVKQYIKWASEEIDAICSQLYQVPFCEKVAFETPLISDIEEYNSYLVVERACALTSGDEIILSNGTEEERHVIDEVVGEGVFSTVQSIENFFAAGTRLLHVRIPVPIPWIATRLAAANIFDKYYSSQVSPNMSDYGKSLRKQARQKINAILSGKTILNATRIGRRLFDPNITDQYGLPLGPESGKDIDEMD